MERGEAEGTAPPGECRILDHEGRLLGIGFRERTPGGGLALRPRVVLG